MKKTLRPMLMAVMAILFFGCAKDGGEDGGGTQSAPVPEIPADPQENNTSFSHRLVLIQHTGTYCPNCPAMTTTLKGLASDQEYNGLYNHVASHSYNEVGDAAYSEAAKSLSNLFCSGNYPEATFNLTTKRSGPSASELKQAIGSLSEEHASAGIAAAAEASDDAIGVTVEVKAAEEGDYRAAVWLLEDKVYSKQEGATEEWQNTHDNALRLMAGKGNARIYGEKLGTLKAKQKAGKSFALNLEDGWNINNCKVLVIVTKADAEGSYDVANSAICRIGDKVSYDYN